MDFQSDSDYYIGEEFGPRKNTLDNLRDWFKNKNGGKIKNLRGAYYIGKTFSIKYLCEAFKFIPIEINWNNKLPAAENMDYLAENIFEYYKQFTLEKSIKCENIEEKIKIIKEAPTLSLKNIRLASLIEDYNRISGQTIVLYLNACISLNFKNESELLLILNANMDNNIKVIFEKYEKDMLPSGFKFGKMRKNQSDTVFLEPPNYDNIKLGIEKLLGNVNAECIIKCIIDYVGCHPAFVVILCYVISKDEVINKDEMIDLDKLLKKVKKKQPNFSYDKLLKRYFNILKECDSDLYTEYINHFMDVTKIENEIIDDMIKWGLCYRDSEQVIKTPILFKNYILKEIERGNIECKDVVTKLNIDKIFKVFDDLDRLASNPSTLESEIHEIFENNLWLFVPGYKKLTSNETLNTALNKVDNKRSKKRRKDNRRKDNSLKKRPDLILKQDEMNNELVLIEFKRPSHCLKIGDEIQIRNYRNDLKRELSVKRIKMILLGGTKDPGTLNDWGDQIEYLTYYDVISKARDQISSLIDFMRT